MAKYEKINLGEGQDTNTGDNLYQAFTKVNDAFDEIESDIVNIDLSEFAKNEDLQEFENETNQKIDDLENDINNIDLSDYATKVEVDASNNVIKNVNGGFQLRTERVNYLPAQIGSFDAMTYNKTNAVEGFINAYSAAFGLNHYNSQQYSLVFGSENFINYENSGSHAFMGGSNNYAYKGYTFTFGLNHFNQGRLTTVLGQNNQANAFASLTFGRFNAPIVSSGQNAWVNGSPIMIVGNGTSESNRSNAYTLFNNGTSMQYGVASYGADYSANFTANSLVSKKYVDDKIANIDVDVDLTNYYIKSEIDTKLNTVGQKTLNATVIGQNSTAGQNSKVFGSNSTAKKDSVIIGNSIVPTVDNVITIGNGLIAKHSGQIIIGEYNIAEADEESTSWNTNNLLTIANGSSTMRKNAYTMDRSGNSVQYGIARYSADFSLFFDQYSLVSKKYVDEKVANIDVDVDLTNYYTKTQADNLLAMRPLFNDVYTKTQSYGKTEVYNKVEIDNKLSEFGQTDITQAGVYPNQQTRIGSGATTNSQWSSAFGFGAIANNQLSTAIGGGSESNRNSIAIGCMAYAMNDSIVIGNELSATLDNVIAIGVSLVPQHRGEIIIGRYNKIADNKINVIAPTNHLFTIANGTSVTNRSNAYELFNNGKSIQYGVASYGGDYSANFNDNTLITKKYVDDKINNNFLINEVATVMDKATLNANYSDKNVGFVLYCTHEDLQTKYVKLSLTEWTAEPYFLVN